MDEATQETGAESVIDRISAAISHDESAEQPTAQEPEAVETEETETEEVEETEVAETSEETPDDETEEVELDAESLAALVGIDASNLVISEDGEISFATKIDGKPGTAKLNDLLKSYQLEGHVNSKSMELAEKSKQLQEFQQQAEQAMAQRLQAADLLVTNAEQELLSQFNGVNWDQLRQTDPGEFAALQTQYGQRYQQIQHLKSQAQEAAGKRAQEIQEQRTQAHQKYIHEQRDELLTKMPTWRDETVAAKEMGELTSYLEQQGFPPEAI